MKRVGLLAWILIIPLFIVVGLWFMVGPLHDWEAKRNTRYSSNFSWQNFEKITNGMTQTTVTNLLGTPLGDANNVAYPGGAMGDASGKVYPPNSTFPIEWLYFSQPQKSLVDYQWVQVVFGPDGMVNGKNFYVTD